jgi:tetracycline resistance efflux pump
MNMPWLSLVPPILTIVAAVWSKKILPSLLFGLLVGSYLLNPSIIGGFETTVESVVKTLTDKSNLQVLLFLYLFSGLITLIRRAGGIEAFSSFVSRYVKSQRGVFLTLWALLPVTFIDCAFRIVGAGSIIRSLADSHKIAKERLAFMLNNTASPIIELIPIATTFVGFNIANIGLGLKAAGVADKHSAYSVLLQAIPFEFFSILVLIITFGSIYFQWKKPLPEAHTLSTKTKREKVVTMNMSLEAEEPEIKQLIIYLFVPMISVVFLSLFFFWYFGKESSSANGTISSVIAGTDPNKAMLVALFISLVVTCIVYFFQKYPVKSITKDLISGGNELMNIIAILVVAWSLGSVSQELNLSQFVQQQLGTSMPAWSVPFALFILSSAVTYFIGSGWAAASLIMPFAISLAVTAGSGIPICVGAVITGGTFGDVTSPVAGMTNMASAVAKSDQMRYLSYANPYNFIALAGAAFLFLVFGYFG